MTLGIARLIGPDGSSGVDGTAFVISGRHALTAHHCLASEAGAVAYGTRVTLRFRGGDVPATCVDGDEALDFALLRLDLPLPPEVEPISLASGCWPHDRWYTVGYPAADVYDEVNGYAVSGSVTQTDARILSGAPAVQLHCEQSAAGFPLEGVSGAPVLVGNPVRAVGLIRWNMQRRDAASLATGTASLAAGAAVFASPASGIARSSRAVADLILPAAGAQPTLDAAAERALMAALPLRPEGRLKRGLPTLLVLALVVVAVLLLGGAAAVTAAAVKDWSVPGAGSNRGEPGSTPVPSTASSPSQAPGPTSVPPTSRPATQRNDTAGGQQQPQPPPQQASCEDTAISISPGSGPVGTTIRVTGSCFDPGEVVVVRFHTTVISQPTAGSTGSFSTHGKVPASYEPFAGSQFSVVASGKRSIRSDSQPFDLTS